MKRAKSVIIKELADQFKVPYRRLKKFYNTMNHEQKRDFELIIKAALIPGMMNSAVQQSNKGDWNKRRKDAVANRSRGALVLGSPERVEPEAEKSVRVEAEVGPETIETKEKV